MSNLRGSHEVRFLHDEADIFLAVKLIPKCQNKKRIAFRGSERLTLHY